MLQWPGDCELSQAITYYGALVSAQTCRFGRVLLVTASSETSHKRADQSAQSAEGELQTGRTVALWSNIYKLGDYIMTLPVGVLHSSQRSHNVCFVSANRKDIKYIPPAPFQCNAAWDFSSVKYLDSVAKSDLGEELCSQNLQLRRTTQSFPCFFRTQRIQSGASASNEAQCVCAIPAEVGDYWFSDYGYCSKV